MKEWIFLSVIGRDRPGIVANVSRVLYQNRCNLEDLSQTAIRGQFAMILIASTSDENALGRLKSEFQDLARDLDLEIHLKRIQPEEMTSYQGGDTEPFIITVRGKDRPGLVYGITEILAERGINITNLNARATPLEGKQEYVQLFEVDIPKSLDYSLIQEKLRKRGQEMEVAVDLQHRDIFRAINQI